FGVITNAVEAVLQPFKYVGQYGVMTEANGLQYMRARYYDPQVGRFISEDPIGFAGGDLNLYQYAHANPIMFMDPWGLCGNNTFGGTVKTISSGIGQAVGAAWNDVAYNEELHRGVEFGVKAAGVATVEVAKIVTMDTLKAYFMPRIPLTQAGGYAFGESVNVIQVTLSLESYGNMAKDISNRIQTIGDDVFAP
ncbi:MAG: RHS repeat-associated core domain-containing protein, partial [Thermodesulfobacteriota bacterium]|nr:RHS repeat-associated core domain-containing protein [Thermodesulfobacteriota bacterium]